MLVRPNFPLWPVPTTPLATPFVQSCWPRQTSQKPFVPPLVNAASPARQPVMVRLADTARTTAGITLMPPFAKRRPLHPAMPSETARITLPASTIDPLWSG